MRYIIIILLSCSQFITAQINTEIYLMDIKQDDSIKLTNIQNISKNAGYDSQPYFLTNTTVIYSGSINGQTEIMSYTNGKTTIFNRTTTGGEYSPQPIPSSTAISAVRLDTSGYQRLYRYNMDKSSSSEIVKDAVVAYYTWADTKTIIAADIVDSKLRLVIHDIKKQTMHDLEINVGRSFHKIPKSNLVSFIDKSQKQWLVKSINPQTKGIKLISDLPIESEDMCWLNSNSFLLAKGNTLHKYDIKNDSWEVFHTFEKDNIKAISRIAVSPDQSKLALVSEVASVPGVTNQ